ncbi:hypothetical protein SteCoe_28772 [Stentor coeruleus]|uniref:Translin-associated factor X-interacting protein 1 N-terminal domain-containing protein n=1 Tax=Stentor coeruleus TaxID=5963 RepID=A0A1R2B7G4_9CILI|nr:hypothetical protein SteCoe_28772 [Stentor coeruleus]
MSKIIRNNYILETTSKNPNKNKPSVKLLSNTTIGHLENPQKLLSRSTAIIPSPYAIKQVRFNKGLDKLKIRSHCVLPKKSIKLFKNHEKSFNTDSKKNLISSFSFLSSEEHSRIETKEISQNRVELLMKKLENTMGINNKFEICQTVFAEILDIDKECFEAEYRNLLQIIKKEYDKIVRYQRNELENQINDIRELENMKGDLSNELEKLIEQNKDLSLRYSELNGKYNEVSDKFLKIASIELDTLDKTDENWVVLLQKSRIYEEAVYNLKKDIKYYKSKTKKMMKLLVAFEKKGYPIEEIYINEVKNKKSLPKYDGSDSIPDDTDNENIVSGKSIKAIRPSKVPELNFSLLKPNSFTSESDSSQLSAYSNESYD